MQAERYFQLVVFALASGLAGPAGAQPAAAVAEGPKGVLRGELQEVADGGSPPYFVLKNSAAGGAPVRCHYDRFTWVERDNQRVFIPSLRPGDKLEIIADRKLGQELCYARSIQVLDNRIPIVNPGYRVFRNRSLPVESFAPRGNLTLGAVVLRLSPETLVVRTRREGEQTFLLRQDTRYMESGLPSELSRLQPNTRVAIRAGKNYAGELEIYQVVWGEIPGPKPVH